MKRLLACILFLAAATALAQTPIPRVSIGVDSAQNPQDVALTLQIVAFMTLLSLAPSLLMMMTGFTRIVIVLSFLRTAIGSPTTPPNPVLIGLSLFLTFYVMAPTLDDVNKNALQPYMNKEIAFQVALERAQAPVRDFMLRQTYTQDLNLFISMQGKPPPEKPEDLSLLTLIPAFIVSELKTAFLIGFYIYIPFLIIDLVVASVLLGMGMMMLPPMVVSLPAKLLVFTLANGWSTLAQALVSGFR